MFLQGPFKRQFNSYYMQARKLKALLNNTSYTVAFYGEYIGIGSPLCHDLIKVTIPEFNITYALDSYSRKGRMAVGHNEELYFIWGKLQELIDSGELKGIVEGNDVIENPLPVYTVREGKLLCTTTDAYGWPNVTVEGYLMHDNDYFKTTSEALEYGIKEYEYTVQSVEERIAEVEKDLDRLKLRKQHYSNIVAGLKLLTPSQKGDVINTMNIDPNTTQQEPATQEAIAEQAPTAEQVAAVEQEAQEQAMQSAEEGGTEG